MLLTVSWTVERQEPSARKNVNRIVLLGYVVGGLIGGLALGAAVATAAFLISLVVNVPFWLAGVLAGALAVAYGGQMLRVWRIPDPSPSNQVPESWRDVFSPFVSSFLYGFGLGAMVLTRINSLMLYSVVLLALGVAEDPLAIVAVFIIAALIRLGSVLIVPLAGWTEGGARTILGWIDPASVRVKRVAPYVMFAVGVVLVGGGLTRA